MIILEAELLLKDTGSKTSKLFPFDAKSRVSGVKSLSL